METYNNHTSLTKFQLKHAWLIVGLFFVATLAISMPVGVLKSFAQGLFLNNPQLNAWVSVLVTIISYIFLFYLINQLFGKATISKTMFEDKHIDWTVYILILLATLSLAIILEPFSSLLLKLLPMPEWVEAIFGEAFNASITTFILAVVLAPLFEEILIRGVVLRGLLTSMSPKKAIIWSSFFFALIHLNPWQALPAFVIGLFLGWLYYKTRSIWPCIFIHFINNLFAFIGITVAESEGLGPETTLEDLTGGYFSSLFAIAIVILIFSLGLLHKRYRLKKGNLP